MQRLKILTGITILFSVFLILISFTDPDSYSGPENTRLTELPKRSFADLKETRLYTLQQQELKRALKSYFDKAIASGDIVGAGVSIVRGDSIVISDGYGKRNSTTNKDVDGQTIFRLGSLSKGFAGILAANLVHDGILDWEDKVSDYIPEFQLGDSENPAKITLANILSHTSGAPYHSYTNLVEAGLPLSAIAKHFKEVQPISDPGMVYSYQNALFALSGEMAYKATGEDIAALLQRRFFNPLEMCSTTMAHKSLVETANVAMPHTKWHNRWRPKKIRNNYYNAIAAGGINASAADMAKWMRFLLGHNPEILTKPAIQVAFNPFVEIKGRNKYYQRWPGHISSHYGFGWRIHKFMEDESQQEITMWHHGGSVNNYRNEIAVYPEADLGICVLLNNNSRLARTVIPDLYKIIKEVYNKTDIKSTLASIPGTNWYYE